MARPIKINYINNPEDFWALVNMKGADECWEWSRYRSSAGYGKAQNKGIICFTHRIAWEIRNGAIPKGMHILHSCDNPPCCNPAHLRLGTPRDNTIDKISRGRHRSSPCYGESHKLSKLTQKDVDNIRAIYQRGTPGKPTHTSIKGLAAQYKVANSLIHRIIKGVSWPVDRNSQAVGL